MTTGIAPTAADRTARAGELAANHPSRAIAAAITAARPFQYPIG
jgi:hypothetical protein